MERRAEQSRAEQSRAEQSRAEERRGEERRGEERRREKISEKKMQAQEKVEKLSFTVHFRGFVALGRKVDSLKRRVRRHLAR